MLVEKANNLANNIICKIDDVDLYYNDMITLKPMEWLNDAIIKAFFKSFNVDHKLLVISHNIATSILKQQGKSKSKKHLRGSKIDHTSKFKFNFFL